MAMSCPARWPWLLCPMDAAPVPPCPDSFLGAQQTYTCSHSCVGGMKRWSRWLSISWVWIGPIMAEFCFSLCSSIFLGRRPVVLEHPPAWWHCRGGGSALVCHPAAGPLDTGGSVMGDGHETWALLPRRLRKGESTGWVKHLDNTFY